MERGAGSSKASSKQFDGEEQAARRGRTGSSSLSIGKLLEAVRKQVSK